MNLKKLFILPMIGLTICSIQMDCQLEKKDNNIPFEKVIFENSSMKSLSSDAEDISAEASVVVKLNYESEPIDYSGIPDEELASYRDEMMKNKKEYHQQQNAKYLKTIDVTDMDDLYVSSYSPYFTFTSEYSQLNENSHFLMDLVSNDCVEQIVISDSDYKLDPSIARANILTGVNPTVNQEELTGEDIVVGILEMGILDKNHDNFKNADVTVRNEWYYIETVTEHTTMMGSIITGKYGLAPNVKLLSVELNGNPVSEIDWLLARNVNIINCSYGDLSPTGVYDSKSAYMDYIVEHYKVTIVCAAGNYGQSNQYVANPGLGYNVITVGACTNFSYTPAEFSSSLVVNGPQKPNLVAPGDNFTIKPFGNRSGTSLAAAYTSGCIALLMDYMPSLKYHPEMVRALVCGSATPADEFPGNKNTLDEYAGAGGLNFTKAIDVTSHNILLRSNTSSNPGARLCGDAIQLNAGDTVKACLSWLAKADGTPNNTTLSEYDIQLVDSSDQVVYETTYTGDNIDMLSYQVTTSGTYYIYMVQRNVFISSDIISLVFQVIEG